MCAIANLRFGKQRKRKDRKGKARKGKQQKGRAERLGQENKVRKSFYFTYSWTSPQ